MINLAPKICSGNYTLWTHVTCPLFTASNYKNFIEFEDFVVNPFPYMSSLEDFIGERFGRGKKRILKRSFW